MKKSRSRKSGFSSDENDPLSLTAERKERQPSKERQTEKKEKPRKERQKVKEDGERSKSKSKKKRETSQERRKEMKAQKKREKKERKKMEHDDVAPKPTTSLSSLIGLKVCSSEEVQPDLKMEKNMQKEKKKKPPIDNQRQSSESDSQVVYDGQFSMDELKSPPQTLFQGDILAKYRNEMTPDTRTVSPILPAPSPVPRVESPGHSSNSPVREDVRERITKLLAFRRQKNCYSTPLNSPIQSFTPEKPSTPKAQDFSQSSLGSPLDRPAESAQPYESVIKTVPSITSTVTSTVTSASMSTPLVTPHLTQQSDKLTLNNNAQIHPVSTNAGATNAYNIPATVTSQSQFGGPMMPTLQGQLPKPKQRTPANPKKPPVKRQPKAKSLLLPNYTHPGQKVEEWQRLLDQQLTKAQPAQEPEKAPRKIYGMKDFISLLQAEYTKIGKDPTVLNSLPNQLYAEEKSAPRRISGMQDFHSAIQSQYAKTVQDPSVADLSKRPVDDEESSAKMIQRKQLADAPKTFSRRAYYKTTKQKEASKQTSEQEAISNELERHIREFQKLKQLQSNGTITIGKIDATKASQAVNTSSQSNPVLVSFLNAPSPIKNSHAVAEVPRSNVPLTSTHIDQKEINSLLQQQKNLVGRSYAPIGPTITPTLQYNNELKASANKVPNATVTNVSNAAVQYNNTLEKAPSAVGSTAVTPNIVRNLQFNNTAHKVPNAALTGQTSHMPNIAHTLQFNNTVNKVPNSTINSASMRATPNTAHASQIENKSKVAANKIVTAPTNEKDNKVIDNKGFQNEFHKMIGQSVLISNNKAYLEYDQEPLGVTQPHPAVARKATGKKDDHESKTQTKTKTAINKPKDKIQNDLVSVMDALRAHKTPSRGPNALAMALQRNEMMKKQTMVQKPRKINDKVVHNEGTKHDSKQTVAPPKPTKVPENKIGIPTNTCDINQLIETEVAYQIKAKNYKIPDPNKLIETVKSMLKKPDILTLTKKAGEQASQFGTSSAQIGESTVKKVEARKPYVPKPQVKATAVQKTVSMPALADGRAPVVIKKEVIPNITSTVIQKVPIQKVAQETPVKHFTVKMGPDSVPKLVEVEQGPISLSNKKKDVTTKSANSQKGSKAAPVQKRTHKGSIPVVQEEYPLLDELMDKELLEEIDELSSDEDTQKSELTKNKVQLPKTDVIANRSTPIESIKSKTPSAEVLPFNADKTQSYVGMRVVREFETCTNSMPSEAYNITKASINNKVNSPLPAASTSAVTVPISNIVLLRPNAVAYPTPNPVFQGSVTSFIVNPTPNLAVYQTTQYAVPTVNQIIIGNASSILNNNTVNIVASEVANTAQNVKQTDETPQFSKANVPKHVNVGKIDAKPKNKIEILEQKTLNFDYRTRNKERKVLHEVQEKQNSPASDNITIKKCEKTTVDKVQTVTTEKNEKMARKDSESVKLKRLAILNREINQRCFYPPIPLYYEPLNAAPVIVKPNSTQERSPSDANAGSKVDNGNVGVTKEVAKENAVNDGSCRRILLRSSNKVKAPETPVIRETKRKALRKPKPKSAPEEGVVAVNKNATPKRVSKRNLTKKALLKKLNDKTVLPDINEPVDIEEQLVAAEIPKDILGAKKSPVPRVISKSEQQDNQSDLNMKETNKFNADDNQTMPAILEDTLMTVSNSEPSKVIDAVISNAFKVEDKISDSISKITVSEEIAEESKVMKKADDVANALNVIDIKNVKSIARVSDSSAPKETISNVKQSKLVNRDSDKKDMKQVSDVEVNIQQNQKTEDRANLTINSKNKEFDTNVVKNSIREENSEDHIPEPRKIKRNLDQEPNCTIEIDDNEPLLNYIDNVKIQSVKIIPTKPGEPSIKCIKITLPNQKSFKVTVSGANDVDIGTLLENPAVQNIITSNWTRDKRYKLNIRHNPLKKEPFEVLKTTEVNSLNLKDTGTVIDLVSDEENDQNNSNNLKTEFGIYRIATESIDLAKLQKDMDQKCTVKLLKHPASFFLSQTIKATQFTDPETGAAGLENRSNPEKGVGTAAETILELSKETSKVVDKIDETEVKTDTDKPQTETQIMTVTETVQNDSTDIPVLDMFVDFDEQPEPKTKEDFNGLVIGMKNKNNIDQEIVENDRLKNVDDVLTATEMVSCDTVENDARSDVIDTSSDDKACVKEGDEIRNDEPITNAHTAHNNEILDTKEVKTDNETNQAEVSLKEELERGASDPVLINKDPVSENTELNLEDKTLTAIETKPFSGSQDEELLLDLQLPENKDVMSEDLPVLPVQTLEISTTEELQNEKEQVSGSNVCLEKVVDCKALVTDEDIKTTIEKAEQTLKPLKDQESEIVLNEVVHIQNIDEADIAGKMHEEKIVNDDVIVIDDEKFENKLNPVENTCKPAELIEQAEVDDVVFIGEEVIDLGPVKLPQETVKESDNSDDVVFVNEERFVDISLRKERDTHDTIDKIIEAISNKIVNEDEVGVKSIIESSIVNEIEDSDDSILPDVIELDSSSSDELEQNELDIVIPKMIDLSNVTKSKSQIIQPDEKINEFKNLLLNDLGVFVNDASTEKPLNKNKNRKSKSAPKLAVSKPCDPKLSQECTVKLVNCDELVENYKIQKAIIQKKCFVQLVKCDNMIETTSDSDSEIDFHLTSPKESPNRVGSPSILHNIPWEEDLHIFFEDDNCFESTGKTSPVMEIFDLISRCSKNNQDESVKMCTIKCTAEWFATKRPANYNQNMITVSSELLKIKPKVLSLLSLALNNINQRLDSLKTPSRKRKLTLLEDIVVMKKSAKDSGKDLTVQPLVSREALQTLEEFKTLTAIDVVTAKESDCLMVSITKLHEVELKGEQAERDNDGNEDVKATLTSPIVMIEQPEKHKYAIPATTFGILTLPQEINSCDSKPNNVIADFTHRDENAEIEMSVSTDPEITSLKNSESKSAVKDCATGVGKPTPVIVQVEEKLGSGIENLITVTNTDKDMTDEVVDTTSNVTTDFNKEPNQHDKNAISANKMGSDTSSCEKQENFENVCVNIIDQTVLTTTELKNQRQDIESTTETVTLDTSFQVNDEPMASETLETIRSVERLHNTEELEADLSNDETNTKDLETEHQENIVRNMREMMDDDTKTSQEESSPSETFESIDQSVENQNNNVIKMPHSPDQTIMAVALDTSKTCDNIDISKSGDNIDKSHTSSQQNIADSEESKMQDNIIGMPLASHDLPLKSDVIKFTLEQAIECVMPKDIAELHVLDPIVPTVTSETPMSIDKTEIDDVVQTTLDQQTESLGVVPNAPDPVVVPTVTSGTTTTNDTIVSDTEKYEIIDDANGETLASNDKLLTSEAIDSKLHRSIECSNSEDAFSTTKVESVQQFLKIENIRDSEEVELPFDSEQEEIQEPIPSMQIVKPDKDIKNNKDDEKSSVFVESIANLVKEMHDHEVSDLTKEVIVSAKEETKDMIALHVEAFNDSNQESDLSCSGKTEEGNETLVVGYEDNVQEEVVLDFVNDSNYAFNEPTSPESNSSIVRMNSSDDTVETNAQENATRKSDFVELLKDSLGCETSREIVDIIESTKVVLEESEDTESVKEHEIQYVNSPLTPSNIRESSTPIDYAEQPGLILKGIEIKDPIVGTCYVFRPIDDSLSDTASSKTDLNESDLLNESTEDVYEILKITDEEEINSPDEYANPETPVTLQDDKIECALPEPKEIEDSNDSDLCVKKPKRTYSPIYKQRSLKRKLSTTDIQKKQEKKYRKGKRIDYPKLSSTSMKELAFGSEYKTLIDYIDSVDFSYSRPFHKDEVDVVDAFSNWPITGPLVKMEDDSNSEPCTDTLLFKDVPDAVREETDKDPLNKSLVDDLSMDCLDTEIKIETTIEESETNFNMGFGEESGRVIQNLEEGGDISKFSAATLSDVKHTQPVLLSKSEDGKNDSSLRESEHDQKYKLMRSINYIQLKEKVRSFFAKIKLDLVDYSTPKDGLRDPIKPVDARKVFRNVPGLYGTEFLKPTALFPTVNVVQVGQLPVSAAAQNPVTIDPRVTQVSDASPSQCSVENSPRSDNSQATIKAEYTELTNADLSLPLVQDISEQNQSATVNDNDAITPEQTVIPKEVEIRNEFKERLDLSNENSTPESKQQDPIDFQYENNTNESTTNIPNDLPSNLIFNASSQQVEKSFVPMQKHENGAVEKTDQIAHAMNAAGITTTPETPVTRPHPLVNLISQKVMRTGQSNAGQTSTNNYQKTSINAMALQQALAQILPPPLNQTSGSDSGQHTQNTSHTPQVLHIVQGKNASGNQITLVDNSQQSVISAPNATQVLHIVQNKSAGGTTSNGTPNTQNFSGLSLVDAGLQQGGNQLLHIVNTGNQKNPNATGQLLKRVNLLTNLTNVQGGNEQKMVQFVCKSADGKSIHLNAPHQRSMVLRLQPIETPNVQANVQKAIENQELSPTQISNQSKEAANQQEIKSRSVYEENYAKFIQNSSPPKTSPLEKSTSLPKFNQAFGKATFQEGTGKQNEINTTSHLPQENAECPPSENTINLDHLNQISSPPLLVRKAAPPTSQAQQNLVQQIKQSIAPMNMTMHGGVIYTRQIPVNIGGGQTINLITVPTTELIDENGQKQQSEIETPIIKIVPQTQTNSEGNTDDNAHLGSSSESQQAPQPQQVLTQMRIKLPMLSKSPQVVQGARAVRPAFFQIQRNMIGGANQGQVYQQLVLTAAPPLGQQTIRLPQAAARQVKVQPETPSPSESQLSSSTLEQLREFDMVLEQVKERSTVQPSGSSNGNAAFSKLHTTSTDTTDSNSSVTTSSTPTEHTQQVLYSIGNTSTMNVAYVNRKSTVTTPTTSTFVRSPDSSGIVDSPSSSTSQITQTVTETTTSTTSTSAEATSSTNQPKAAKVGSKSVKSRPKPTTATPSALSKVNNPIPPKTSTQKPLEDEQTTQRILYILAEYKEQVENSPDKDKPAPRRRSNPPSNPGSSKRKKSSSGSRRHGCTRDHSPIGDDNCRTMGSEDSSCGTSQGDCTENCSIDAHSPQDSPRKVVRKLTFEQETPLLTQPRIQPPRNVIVADGQTITVARSATGKPTTAVLMPANYILPVSMMKGGQQIAIVTNRGPKLLTVGGPPGEAGAANALILQRLIGPAGLKPVLARPGVRHVRLPATALHNLQAFNIQTTIPTAQPPDSTASPAPAPTPPELVETKANSSPWAEREPTTSEVKPERGATPEASEPWHLQPSTDTPDYTYEEPVTSRADAVDRTVLVSIACACVW